MLRAAVVAALLLTSGAAHADAAVDAPYRHIADAFARLDPAPLRDVFADDAVLLFFEDGKPPALTVSGKAIVERLAGTLDRLKKANRSARITVRLNERRSEKDAIYDTGFYRLVVRDAQGKEDTEYGAMMLELRRDKSGAWRHRVDANGPGTREAFDAAGKAAIYD